MKFILILSVCSFVTGECKQPIIYSKTLDEFVKKSKLNVETANELQLAKYKRFMIIGTQHV